VSTVDVAGGLDALTDAAVDFVLTGSVAAAAYGVPVQPRDLDIAPALDEPNLRRLAELLAGIGAKPHFDPAWPFSQEECERWTPRPATVDNLDHLFETTLGPFDVVPSRSGTYDELRRGARRASWRGGKVLVADPADLVAQLRLGKAKHAARQPQLEAVLAAGRTPDLSIWARE
jgi:hypothetical protein